MRREFLRLSSGERIAYVTAGDPARVAIVLLHGFPSSADTFRDVIPGLADLAFVVAPDLPGFGESDVLERTSFDSSGAAVTELLEHLGVRDRILYVHDFGAPVALRLAMDAPKLVRGLVIQNANAHESGMDESWDATRAFWADPTAEHETAAMAHLTLDGIRDQYVAGVPDDVARNILSEVWERDWEAMNRPGRLQAQRDLIADYGRYVDRFPAIAEFLRREQPPALMIWGRHDAFFAIDEVLSWMQDLPRMETHVLDGGHFLLETHAGRAIGLLREFVTRTLVD